MHVIVAICWFVICSCLDSTFSEHPLIFMTWRLWHVSHVLSTVTLWLSDTVTQHKHCTMSGRRIWASFLNLITFCPTQRGSRDNLYKNGNQEPSSSNLGQDLIFIFLTSPPKTTQSHTIALDLQSFVLFSTKVANLCLSP